jgi:hypothetical protein
MASVIKIDPLLSGAAGSAVDIRANTQRLRTLGKGDPAWVFVSENFDNLAGAVNRLEKAARQDLSPSRIQIDAADILDLVVGGRTGPGQLTILSGPPSYTRIGFDGTETTGISFTISTVSGATINTTTTHSFEVGDIVLIQGGDSINHLGYWVVATTPTATSFTVADPPAGTGTGGTVTFQYAGGWRRTLAIGGEGFDSAPFFANSRGQMYIGKFGSITLLDSQGQAKGFIGVETEPFKVVGAIANNGSGLIRLTVTGHGWDQGDNILVFLLGGNANGDWMINVVDANHVDLRDSTFTGGYTTPGQAYRYYGPFWGQAIAGGGSGYADAAFRVFSDGSLRLGTPSGARLEFDVETGTITIINAAGTRKIFMEDGYISIVDKSSFGDIGQAILNANEVQLAHSIGGAWNVAYGSGGGANGFVMTFQSSIGTPVTINGIDGKVTFGEIVSLNVPLDETNGGTGADNYADARDASHLDVYSRAEVDALIAAAVADVLADVAAAYSPLGHSHSGSTGVTDGHSHTVTVS